MAPGKQKDGDRGPGGLQTSTYQRSPWYACADGRRRQGLDATPNHRRTIAQRRRAGRCAGAVGAARNGFGVVGVAPEASLVVVRIADDEVGIQGDSWCLDLGKERRARRRRLRHFMHVELHAALTMRTLQ